MAIALHVEIATRELDSKLLLAIRSAAEGHAVVVGDVIGLCELGLLPQNSIFHTKSTVPSPVVMARHRKLRNMGLAVTSLDEEGPGVEHGLARWYRVRYSAESMSLVNSVFCWGPDEFHSLQSEFPSEKKKFILTGSPRADLWLPKFASYWAAPEAAPARPYVLFSSNMGVQRRHPSEFVTDLENRMHDRAVLLEYFERTAERYKSLASFVQAIDFLGRHLDDVDLVLRPHPTDDVKVWERLLEGIPRVRIASSGTITEWLKGCVVLVHNGCTTALEAAIGKKGAISFVENKQSFLKFPNALGTRVSSADELKHLILSYLQGSNGSEVGLETYERDMELIRGKIHLGEDSLAVDRIVAEFNKLGTDRVQISAFRLVMIRIFLFSKAIRTYLENRFGSKRKHMHSETDKKFPKFERRDIECRIRKLSSVLGLTGQVSVSFLGSRTILVRPSA